MLIKAIDFFCGAGGLTHGLIKAGIQVLAGVDIDSRLRETYEKNNHPSKFICADINDLSIISLRNQIGIGDDELVLYAACSPCQPFSTLNHMKGKDERKSLILSFANLVKVSPPDFILVENVPGLNNSYGKEIYSQFICMLKECGFNYFDSGLIDAQFFGVPQVRRRFILLASRHGEIKLPKPNKNNVRTVREHIGDLHPIEDGETYERIANHTSRKLPVHIKNIAKAVPKNGGSRQEIKDKSILLSCHQRNPKAHKDVFGRMNWDKPAPTLTCRCTDVYCGRFTHPEQDRGLSLREAACLQTFPRNYTFFGNFAHVSRQIGNAVPVKLATKLGVQIIKSAQLNL